MIFRKVLYIVVAILLLTGCSRFSYVDRQLGRDMVKAPYIRVKILESDKLELSCEGTYRINCISEDESAKGYYSVAPLIIKYSPGGIILTEKSGFVLDTALVKIYVSPNSRDSHLRMSGKPFRGVLEIHRGHECIDVINILNIESYLKGVLPPEIGRLDKDAFEALKAQAVAARTYAYSRIKANEQNHYDLVNSIMDQIYIGIEGEYKLANRAIDETHGEILVHNGNPITAYYHSTCGGKTEDVDNAWDKRNSPCLKSVDDSGFCEWSKFYTWSMTWKPDVLAGYLREYLGRERDFNGSPLVINDIKILERFPSGRISHLAVETDKGEFLFFKDQIRWAFRRPNRPDLILPSSNFDIRLWHDQDGNLIEISAEGRGYGHGVGMCQTGAIGRARAGQKYDRILKTYYQGVQIEQVY